jgi:hypothetical protein
MLDYYETAWQSSIIVDTLKYSTDYETVRHYCHETMENAIKSLLETILSPGAWVLTVGDLRLLYTFMCFGFKVKSIDLRDLRILKNPEVSRENCQRFIAVARKIVEQVNDIRQSRGYPVKQFFFISISNPSNEPLFDFEAEEALLSKIYKTRRYKRLHYGRSSLCKGVRGFRNISSRILQ